MKDTAASQKVGKRVQHPWGLMGTVGPVNIGSTLCLLQLNP